jgi:hypothetical protein
MEIKLTQGKVAIVDADDYEFLSQFKWYALRPTGNKCYYAARGVYDKVTKKRSIQYMHKVLLETTDYVDHKNRNSLDNRRCNLRSATPSQSRMNSTPKGVSKYMGVSWSKGTGKWQATCTYQGKRKWIGGYNTEIEAASAYNEWVRGIYGEFANLNVVD